MWIISRSEFNEELINTFWFWQKGKLKRKREKDGTIVENWLPSKTWANDRIEKHFNLIFDQLKIKFYMNNGRYKGQTKAEFLKNYRRVKDIVDKSAGNVDKAISLSKTQANRITDEWKAINRSMCARELYNDTKINIYMDIFEVFFQRAYELGSVSKQDYREYKLQKLGIL